MAETRDIRYKLTVEAGDQGAKSLKATADAAKEAAAQVKALSAEQQKLKAAAAATNPAGPRAGLAGAGAGGTDPFAGVKQLEAQRQAMLQRPGLPAAAPYQPPPPSLRAAEQPSKPPAEVKTADQAKAQQQQQGGSIGQQIAARFGVGPEQLAGLGSAAAGIKALATGLNAAAKAVDALGDSSLSAGQKMRKVAEALDPTGVVAAMGALADAVSGKTEAIRKATREEALAQAEANANTQKYTASLPLRTEADAVKSRAAVLANLPTAFNAAAAPSRDTFQGDVDYQRFERRQPLEFEKAKADAELNAAREAAARAAAERQRLETEVAPASRRARQLKAEFDRDFPEGQEQLPKRRMPWERSLKENLAEAGVQAALPFLPGAGQVFATTTDTSAEDAKKVSAAAEVAKSLIREKELRQQLAAASQQEAATIKAKLEAERAQRQANLAIAKDDLAILKEKSAQVAQSATSFGSLSAVDKQAALEAAQQLKGRGYETLTPEQKAAISAAGFGQQLNFAAQQSALNDPFFQQISQLFGQEFDLKGLQDKELKLQAQIGVTVKTDEAELAKQLKDVLVPALEAALKNLAELAKAEVDKVKVGQAQAAAAQ